MMQRQHDLEMAAFFEAKKKGSKEKKRKRSGDSGSSEEDDLDALWKEWTEGQNGFADGDHIGWSWEGDDED